MRRNLNFQWLSQKETKLELSACLMENVLDQKERNHTFSHEPHRMNSYYGREDLYVRPIIEDHLNRFIRFIKILEYWKLLEIKFTLILLLQDVLKLLISLGSCLRGPHTFSKARFKFISVTDSRRKQLTRLMKFSPYNLDKCCIFRAVLYNDFTKHHLHNKHTRENVEEVSYILLLL